MRHSRTAYLTPDRPRKALEQIKGISEQKASKLLAEGRKLFAISEYNY
jgi:hypothetical protein